MEIKNQIHTDGNTIFLHDFIGEFMTPSGKMKGIDANDFINLFNRLDNSGHDVINIRINSGGGSVIEGFSIYSALANSKTPIHIYVDGIAASIAAIIAMAGNTISMADHALLMIHDPFRNNGNDEEGEDLNKIKQSLVTILSNKSGITEERVSSLMSKETWMTASEAITLGFANEIGSIENITIDAVSIEQSEDVFATIQTVFNAFDTALNNTHLKEEKNMKEVCERLGLNPEAESSSILNSIDYLMTENEANTAKVSELVNEIEELKEALSVAETTVSDYKNAEISNLVDTAIANGKINEDTRETWINMATENFDNTKTALDGIENKTIVPTSINELINSTETENTVEDDKDHRWYEVNDPAYLVNLKKEDPAAYEELYNAFYKA